MNKISKYFLTAAAVVLIIIGLHYLSWLKPLENLLLKALAPAQGLVYQGKLSADDFYQAWIRQRDLLKANNDLKEKVKDYNLNLSRLRSLEEENQLLKTELNFVKERQLKYVAAKIFTGVSDPLSQTVIIDRGQNDGLIKGLAVVAGSGILVGKIIKVNDNSSQVLLLTDNQSRVAATVQNSDQTAGLVEGQFGLSFSMTNIPQDQAIAVGDFIVTSGLEGQIPKNLLIAQVASVKQAASEIFKTAILQPIIPFDNLSQVLVLIP